MFRRALAMAAGILALLILAGLGSVAWMGSSALMKPPWYEHRTPEQGLRPLDPEAEFFIWDGGYRDPETDLGLAYETVEIPAGEGSTLRGWVVPGEAGATAGVVAVHGAGNDRRDFLRHVPMFHRAGLPVVLFDCRDHGISDGRSRGISLGLRESEDVSAVVAWARRELGLERVAVIGTSQGGASVILAAAADPGIDVVVAENPFTSIRQLVADTRMPDGSAVPEWAARLVASAALVRMGGLDALSRPSPLEAVGEIAPRPLLLLHGSEDPVIPVEHSRRPHAAAGDPAELWILEGARHAALFDHAPAAFEERVMAFLERALPLDHAERRPAGNASAPR
jgi:pimeloyl-ACP methyl ester carboxylesterase